MIRATDAALPFICLQASGASTREDIDRINPIYLQAYARNQPIICISDARLALHDAKQRKLWAVWAAENFEKHCGVTRQSILLLDSALLRGALIALHWLSPPKVPEHPVADVESAIELARELARKEALYVKEATWAYMRNWLNEGYPQAKAI